MKPSPIARRLCIGMHCLIFMVPMDCLAENREQRPKSQADNLFEEGKRALKAGNWEHACASFMRSESLDPSPSTLVKIARCHEHDKNPKAAYDSYEEALQLLGERAKTDPHSNDLERLIAAAQTALVGELGHWRFRLIPNLQQFELQLDGRSLGPGAIEATTVVAPGKHHIAVRAAGRRDLNLDLVAVAGETRDVSLTLESDSPPRVATIPPTTAPDANSIREQARGAPRKDAAISNGKAKAVRPNRGQRIAAVATGSLGSVLLGIGGYLALRTHSLVNLAKTDNHCDQDWRCDSVGMSRIAEANRAQSQAILLAAGGSILLGASVVLWATAPVPSKTATTNRTNFAIRLAPAGGTIVGQW